MDIQNLLSKRNYPFTLFLLFLSLPRIQIQYMMKITTLLFSLVLLLSCSNEKGKPGETTTNKETKQAINLNYLLDQGQWLGQLQITENKSIPFNFEIIEDSIFILNSKERIGAKIREKDGGFIIKMPVFDSEIHFKNTKEGLKGYWHNYAKKNYKIAFSAIKKHNDTRARFNISKNDTLTNCSVPVFLIFFILNIPSLSKQLMRIVSKRFNI